MKVRQLIEMLSHKDIDPEMDVLISSDPEGNSYGKLFNWGVVNAMRDGHEYSVFDPDDEEANEEYGDELYKVLCFWPS